MISRATSSGERRRICRSLSSSQRTRIGLVPARVQKAHERRLDVVDVSGQRDELGRRAVEEQLGVGEHEETVGVALGLAYVVGREQDRRARLGPLADELPYPLAVARVQRGRGLVE